jgi:hypothetical protein
MKKLGEGILGLQDRQVMVVGPALFLMGSPALDKCLRKTTCSPKLLIPIAVNAIDILLCYQIDKAAPSKLATRTIVSAVEAFAEEIAACDGLPNLLSSLLTRIAGVDSSILKPRNGKTPLEPKYVLRGAAHGNGFMRAPIGSEKVLRELCLNLHLCNFSESIRLLFQAQNSARLLQQSHFREPARTFVFQAKRYLEHVVKNIDSDEVVWEYRLLQKANRKT